MNTAKSFIEFVNSQDPEKEIDHSEYETCAVGEFCLLHEICILEATMALQFVFLKETVYIGYNQRPAASLDDFLGMAGIHQLTEQVPTYGDLSEFIDKNVDMTTVGS